MPLWAGEQGGHLAGASGERNGRAWRRTCPPLRRSGEDTERRAARQKRQQWTAIDSLGAERAETAAHLTTRWHQRRSSLRFLTAVLQEPGASPGHREPGDEWPKVVRQVVLREHAHIAELDP